MIRSLFLTLTACALVGPAAARQAPAPAAGPARPAAPALPAPDPRAVVVAHDGPGAFATAPGWAAFFRPGEVRFAPAADGGGAWVSFAPESVRRGSTLLPAPLQSRPRVDGRYVLYPHRGFQEVYEARLGGLKQSFVFPSAPAGRGDLVVRLRLDLDGAGLVPGDVRTDGIVLEREGASVLRIGAVIGIDADGREATGELRLTGDRLDLVLPGDFVDDAAYPLVLDPLIQPFYLVPGTGGTDSRVDVAWEADTRRFCLAWTRNYSGVHAYLAQLFEEDGTPVWPLATLGWDSTSPVPPAVCAVGSGDEARFVMAHGGRTGLPSKILVTSLRATDMQMHQSRYSVPVLVDLDIGGSSDDSMEACLVWNEFWGVRAQRFRAPAPWLENDRPVPHGEPVQLAGGPGSEDSYLIPRISQSNGEGGSWLVVWERFAVPQRFPEARAIGPLGPSYLLPLSSTGQGQRPSCDGDGRQFFVAHKEGVDIVGTLLTLTGPWFSVDHVDVLAPSEGELLRDPQVAITPLWDGNNTFTVAWLRQDPGTPLLGTVRYRAFKTDDLEPFGPEQTLASQVRHLRIASLYGASPGIPSGYSCLFTMAVSQSDGLRYGIAIP